MPLCIARRRQSRFVSSRGFGVFFAIEGRGSFVPSMHKVVLLMNPGIVGNMQPLRELANQSPASQTQVWFVEIDDVDGRCLRGELEVIGRER
jgi:hypothetical protein